MKEAPDLLSFLFELPDLEAEEAMQLKQTVPAGLICESIFLKDSILPKKVNM